MSPELRIRITAANDTAGAFGQVKQDAVAASGAIASSADRATAALNAQGTALLRVADNSRLAASQQRNLMFQLNDIGVSLAGGMNPLMVIAQQGSQIATIYGAQEGGLGRALKETGNLAAGLVTKFWPIAAVVGAGSAAIAGMQAEINKTSEAQVSFGDVALASWQVFSEGAYNMVLPAIEAIGGWLTDLWDYVRPGLVALGNGMIATFLGTFDAVKVVWGALPSVMGDIAYSTANTVLDGIEFLVNGSIGMINDLIGLANKIPGVKMEGLKADVGFDLTNPFAGAMGGVAEEAGGAISGAFGNDYLGGLFGAISDKAKTNSLTKMAEDAEKAGGSLKAANDNFDALTASVNEGGAAWANNASEALGSIGQITGALAGAFQDNKALALANAVVNTAEGMTKAISQGGMFALPIAAAIGVAGAAQIATIASAQPGSASTPSMPGGLPSAATGSASPTSSNRAIYLNIQGSGSINVDDFADQLLERIKDGGYSDLVRVIRKGH